MLDSLQESYFNPSSWGLASKAWTFKSTCGVSTIWRESRSGSCCGQLSVPNPQTYKRAKDDSVFKTTRCVFPAFNGSSCTAPNMKLGPLDEIPTFHQLFGLGGFISWSWFGKICAVNWQLTNSYFFTSLSFPALCRSGSTFGLLPPMLPPLSFDVSPTTKVPPPPAKCFPSTKNPYECKLPMELPPSDVPPMYITFLPPWMLPSLPHGSSEVLGLRALRLLSFGFTLTR